MTLGQKLRQLRHSRGLSQAQAAEGCITRNMLSQIENDQAKPSMRTLEHLANTLGVSVGWLLSDEQTDAEVERLRKARALYQAGDDEGCLALFQQSAAQQSDEVLLLCALAAARLAGQLFAQEQFSRAQELAQKALCWNEQGLYSLSQIHSQALAVLARCALQAGAAEDAIGQYRAQYLAWQPSVPYHLTMARYHLQQEHIQAAEREIWAIIELPEENRAEYLILRGRIAARREEYENAAMYLHQAEALALSPFLQRELYMALEVCCRELGDYKQAYLYASKQLAMQSIPYRPGEHTD